MRSVSEFPASDRLLRRDLLRVGSLGAVGLALPEMLRAHPAALRTTLAPKAKACILFFLEGGPPHQDLWDMKPDAPVEIRGAFEPIDSSLPGVPVCEHLPMLARQMHHVALIRAVHHRIVDHNAGTYYALTGRSPLVGGRLILGDEPENFPPYGAVLAKYRTQEGLRVPEFVHLPDVMSNNGKDLPGQRAGFLGPAFDPFIAGDPSAPDYRVPGLALLDDLSSPRLSRRRVLLDALDGAAGKPADDAICRGMETHYARAFTLLSSDETQRAFDLSREPYALRERYGFPDRVDRSVEARKFGGLPHLGQSMLLARRLIESGVRLVTVCTGRRIDQSWDTHRNNFALLKQSLLPYTDRAFSALLEDLAQRGMLDETLVVAMGEFGRTPRVGQVTSGAGADSAGRDHWPHCYTVLMAGGGIRPGFVYGASDSFAAYPKSNPVTPEDIAATIYHALGLSPETLLHDRLDRPHALALGKPIVELFA